MKNINLVIILIIIGAVGWVMFFNSRLPSTMVAVNKSYLDSLANLKPDTIIKTDTIKPPPIVVTMIKEVPVPVENEHGNYTYQDSLVNEHLSVHLTDVVSRQGIILNRTWDYQLFVPLEITREIIIEKPIPMPYPIPCDNEKKLSYYGKIGIGTQISLEGGIILKETFSLGIDLSRKDIELKVGYIFNK